MAASDPATSELLGLSDIAFIVNRSSDVDRSAPGQAVSPDIFAVRYDLD